MDRNTVLDVLTRGTARLKANRLNEARLLCERLVSSSIGCGRLELYMRWPEPMNPAHIRRVSEGIEKLMTGEPLQYILGNSDFMGRDFKVNRDCLIPRPETEELVEIIISFDPLWKRKQPLIADIGTGCGCIAVTLALDRPEGQYLAIDISEKALELAKLNARSHGVSRNIRFIASNVLDRIGEYGFLDAVVSNPPYIRTADWKHLSVQIRNNEPRIALDGGARGFDVISPIITQAFRALKKEGFLFMEIGEDQWPETRSFLVSVGFYEYKIKQDLAGKNRFVLALKP